MLYILPFEKEVYEPLNIKSDFVGHYLLDDIPSDYIQSPLPENNSIALLPGSRIQEIDRMLEVMLEAASLMNKNYHTQAVVAGVSGIYDYEEKLMKYRSNDIEIVYDDSRWVINNSRLVLTASGTATLETGIIGRPMVVIYRTGAITYQIARYLVKLDKIALVNLVLGEKVVPEILQNKARASSLASHLEKYLLDIAYTRTVKNKLDRVPETLGGPGASKRAADIVSEYLC
jgi:lipid-A-disaccharide synthase